MHMAQACSGAIAVALLFAMAACDAKTSGGEGALPDASDAASDAGGDAPSYGTCGATTHTCLCACDGGSSCETACYSANAACTKCLDEKTTACCPTEYPAWKQCLSDATTAPSDGGAAPCAQNDPTCVDAFCAQQAAALQACLGSSACKAERGACTGDATCGK